MIGKLISLISKLCMGKNKAIVLCYHSISKMKLDKHLKFIETIFRIETLQNIIEPSIGENRSVQVAFTMDDLYRKSYRAWVEVICKRNVPSTVFIPTWYSLNNDTIWSMKLIRIFDVISMSFIDINKRKINFQNRFKKKEYLDKLIRQFQDSHIQTQELDDICNNLLDYNCVDLMDDQLIVELKELKRDYDRFPLLSIQSHTHRHYKLAFIKREEVEQDVQESLKILNANDLFRDEKRIICYPYGSDRLIGDSYNNVMKYFDAGVVLGKSRLNGSRNYLIPRLGVYESDSILRLWIKIIMFSWKK